MSTSSVGTHLNLADSGIQVYVTLGEDITPQSLDDYIRMVDEQGIEACFAQATRIGLDLSCADIEALWLYISHLEALEEA